MCGVIAVDEGRSRSTNLWRDAYHCLDIVMIIWSSINFPIVICLPTVCYFSWENPLVKPTPPGLFLILFAFAIYFPLPCIFRSINLKTQKYLIAIYFILHSIYQYLQLSPVNAPISGTVTRKELTTPLTRRVASICYLCAGAVYVVLLGSPTGSITLVSYLREIPTAAVLHHPFLFGEIPT